MNAALSPVNWTARLYRSFARGITKRLPATASSESAAPREEPLPRKQSPRVWFHAASAGELESLWPVIRRTADEGRELWLTVFSPSGLAPLERLARELRESGAKLRFAGFSPREGFWLDAIERADPDVFVTAKYEAWPELWMGLQSRKVPLVVVAARARSSLKWAARACRWLGSGCPDLHLLAADESDREELLRCFPKAKVEVTGDPRWDRVRQRSQAGHPRAAALVEAAKSLPHPWGIFGSCWLSDLKFWGAKITRPPGTLWIVPHLVDETTIGLIERHLQGYGISTMRSSTNWQIVRSAAVTPRAVVIDEIGFLSELYKAGDWAFVGGGFGKSLHSTVEPAIQGMAVGAGPRGSGKFSEVAFLRSIGQLELPSTSGELDRWLNTMETQGWNRREAAWLNAVERRFGASEGVWKVICAALDDRLGR